MSDVTMEKRLRLVKQIRSRYYENQQDLSNREMILYGRSSRPAEVDTAYPGEDPQIGQISFFRVRLAVAVFLAVAVIFCDYNGMKLAGIATERIFQAISADFQEVLETWSETSQPSI